MPALTLRRQFIVDSGGRRVAVALPIEEYEALMAGKGDTDPRDALMAQASHDERFMSDLRETMDAFAVADRSSWDLLRGGHSDTSTAVPHTA